MNNNLIKLNTNAELIKAHLDKNFFKKKKEIKKPCVALVGVGPHARRIYLNYFKKHRIDLSLVIELDSKRGEIKKFLSNNKFKSTKVFTIPDSMKDFEHLSLDLSNQLLAVCDTLEITHIIIATEPKAHFMYLEFALKNNINVLTDKPISVVENMTSLNSIRKVRDQYYQILDLANKSTASCKVMCQRQYHRGYEEVKKVLKEVVTKYQVPITYIDIFHSDGNWEMPHDLNKENHPYKYGYGKLYHSGYHFIDLLSDFIKINDNLTYDKKIIAGDIYSKVFTPNDELHCINMADYKRLFADQKIPTYYNDNSKPNFSKYGEKNFHSLLSFYNKNGFTITTASLNLLHDGVSRRSWIQSRDYYKQNGRIRHERMNIEVGHLLNIQIHSYQSKEVNERTSDEESVGGLEHFDIYFFKNPLLNDKPFKEIHLGDLYTEQEKKEFMGYNELSREIFLTNFLKNKNCKGDIRDQALAIEILFACSKGIRNHYLNKNKIEKIQIRNKHTYLYDIEKLKSHSNFLDRSLEKKMIKNFACFDDIYQIDVMMNYIKSKHLYEVYMVIDDDKTLVSGLLTKVFRNKIFALLYYYYLSYFAKNKSILKLKSIIEKTKACDYNY